MVKKKGPKSTGKKKSTAKKKAAPKKSAATSGAVKKAAAKPKPKAKPKAKKPASPKKAKVSIKNLLLRQFDTSTEVAKSLYKPKVAPSEIPDSYQSIAPESV
ncbi:MAG: hypothetical protein JRJ47_08900 [Deltaproteobacteria bacterium]|nr:hypothetical protein [Deltaproteobacteria bacterium]